MTSVIASLASAQSSLLESSLVAFAQPNAPVGSEVWGRLRASALETLTKLGLPGRRAEAFRFSALTAVSDEPLRFGADLPGALVESLVPNAIVLTVANGNIRVPAGVPAGLRVQSLRMALEQGEVAATAVGSLVSEQDGWVAANTAGFADGYLVVVEAGVKLQSPVELVFVQGETQVDGQAIASLPRVLVTLDKGAELELVERHISVGEQVSLGNAVVEIVVGEGATLSHSRWVDVGECAYGLAATAVSVGKRATYRSWSLCSRGRYVRHDLQVYLRGRGAVTSLDGLYYGRSGQLVDNHVRVWHEQPEGTTKECYRGVIEDGGRGVFDGIIYVGKGAMKTDARQENRNLLLGPEAVINTKPHLEIDADDVSCSHGATVGQLDEEQLFYLRARGIEESKAKELLTWAFAKEIVERCPVAALGRASAKRLSGAVPEAVGEESGV